MNSVLENVTAVLLGTFDCMDTSNEPAQVTLTLQGITTPTIELPQNLPCFCPNCVGSYSTVMNGTQGQDWPGYIHGGNNTFQILVTGANQICLNRVDLSLQYYISMYLQ